MKLCLVIGFCLVSYIVAQTPTTPDAASAPAGTDSAPVSDAAFNPASTDIPDDLFNQFISKIEELENAYDKRFHLRIGGPTAAEFVDQVVKPTPTPAPQDPAQQSEAQQAEEASPQSDLIKLIQSKLDTLSAHVSAPVPGQETVTTAKAADGTTEVTTTTTIPANCPVCTQTGGSATDTVTTTTKQLTADDILAMAKKRAEALIAEHYRRMGTPTGTGSATEAALSS